MKPAKKFVVGAVYALKGYEGDWYPLICMSAGDYSTAALCHVGVIGAEAQHPYNWTRDFYRIRARDWEPWYNEFAEFGPPMLALIPKENVVPHNPRAEEEARFLAEHPDFDILDPATPLRIVADPQQPQGTARVGPLPGLVPWLPSRPFGPFAFLACTCGLATAPARKHWASCPVKQEIEK